MRYARPDRGRFRPALHRDHDDITANLDAIDELMAARDALDLILVESGGDNLTATFSLGLVDAQIFVIGVAGGIGLPRGRARVASSVCW